MNGRPYPAAERSSGPVLAWNVEPTQFPAGTYPEMPAAAAAAVSPVVPAAASSAAPPDPYGRCWQSQVDPSACFPYFGTLYGSSLPPPSYRMQPGCLSNLGQFWPPTPPPEGCVRYDGTNNLHYCSPLTPVYRHGESLPQNMLGVHQRLGHYSHLIDINKDSGLKRMDSCLDGIQRQKALLNAKTAKEAQQRSCSCYECNDKSFSRGTPQSVNKENISGSKLVEPKISDDKSKLKSCKRVKDEGYSHLRSSSSYHPNGSAISNYSCSVEQNAMRMTTSMQGLNQPDYGVQSPQKMENPVSVSSCVRQDFLRPQSNSFPINRCASNSLMTVTSPKDVMQEMHSAQKSAEHLRHDNSDKVSHHKMHVSSGFESCPCPPVQTSSGSNSHRSTEKSCFSPPYMSSRTLYNNYPENSTHNKTPGILMIYGNNYNASPLKNVYFSYYESENFDMGSGVTNRKSKDNCCKQEKVSSMGSFNNQVTTPSSSQSTYVIPPASTVGPLLNGNSVPHASHFNSGTVPSDAYGCVYQSSCLEQQKASDSKYVSAVNGKHGEIAAISGQMTKMNPVRVKQEKFANTDCKFQKSHHSSKISPPSDTVIANGVLNLSTSLRCPKIEPEDQMSMLTSETRTSIGMPMSCSAVNVSMCDSSIKYTQAHPSSLKTENANSFYSGVPSGHLMSYPKVTNLTTPQMQDLESDCSAAVPEDVCPIAQMAPSGGAELPSLSKMPTTGYEAPTEVRCQSVDLKDGLDVSSKIEDQVSAASASLGLMPSLACPMQEDCHGSSEQVGASERDMVCDPPVLSSPADANSTSHSGIHVPCSEAVEAVSCMAQYSTLVKSDICEDFNSSLSIKVEQKSTTEDEGCESGGESCKYEPSSDLSSAKVEDPSNVCSVKVEPVQEDATELSESEQAKSVEDCHGLYILLQGIAHKKNIDSSEETKPSCQEVDTTVITEADTISSKMKGLSLLCALAEEQFFMEFGKDVTLKHECSISDSIATKISSNYPVVKEELVVSQTEEMNKPCSNEINPELKMRKRLAELQQKYREKQKELARLKPKKIKSPSSSEASSSENSFIGLANLPNACQNDNCSKESADNDVQMPSVKPEAADGDSIGKQAKFSSKNCTKSSSDENSASENTSAPNHTEKCARRSKTTSRSIRQHTATRRRAERTLNLRGSVSLRSKSSSMRRSCNGTSGPHIESDISDGAKSVSRQQRKFKHKPSMAEQNGVECNKLKVGDSIDIDVQAVQFSMKSPKKRKPENPKRFMPSKQVRLTETIIAKQLRNRILFESPGCGAKKADETHYDVPEELFDALRKCNIGDGQSTEDIKPDITLCQQLPVLDEQKVISTIVECPNNVVQRVLKMTVEHLLENQRILALEEGLFYAGTIKEIQSSDVYSIALDGQRGNKRHLFSKEEMLSQTIIETKPISLEELPEGTRICAYWSHQYRCLYPGTVVRAPAPSPDWSEPRVFVEFDDGDSAQIAMKNIRFLPPDIQLSEEDIKENTSQSKTATSDAVKETSSSRKRKSATKELRRHSKLCKSDYSKSTTSCSNDSTMEEYESAAAVASPSHRLEQENQDCETSTVTKVSRRTRRQLSKKRSGSKNKLKDPGSSPEKSKKRKRYKDRHKHHHHHRHHHRHHRHCHHHRHCKKRKHHKRASNVDNIINVVIPSSSIPFSNLIAKSTRSSMKDAEAQCVGHSKKESKQLPQPGFESGDSKTGIAKEEKVATKKECTSSE